MNARRLFAGVAVAATEEMRRALAELQRELRGERIRWTRLEKLHLTVEFFGFTEKERIPELAAALAKAAADARPFPMSLGGLGMFRDLRHPRVLWMGVDSEGLVRLHGCVQARLREAGWTPEARPFAPHLTLGRMERLRDTVEFQARVAAACGWPAQIQTAGELILYESTEGQYVPIERWPLG